MERSKNSININIGPFSSFAGVHLWNGRDLEDPNGNSAYYRYEKSEKFPRALFIDYMNNVGRTMFDEEYEATTVLGAWSGRTQKISQANPVTSLWGAERTLEERLDDAPNDSFRQNAKWTDFLKAKLLDQSYCTLPSQVFRDSFDTYFNGTRGVSTFITSDYIEDFLEQVRFFAEECDYLSTLDIIMDLDDGFGGLGMSLLPELRDEYGSIDMPVWGISNSELNNNNALHANMQLLGLPMIYSQITELASVFLPLSLRQTRDIPNVRQNRMHSLFSQSAVIANNISTILSSASNSRESWIYRSTNNRSYPICSSEILLPFPSMDIEKLIFEKFGSNEINRFRNPFMHQLSFGTINRSHVNTVKQGSHASSVEDEDLDDVTNVSKSTSRPYTNLVFLKSHYPQDFIHSLLSKSFETSYVLSEIFVDDSPHALPSTYPLDMFAREQLVVDEQEQDIHIGSMASIGSEEGIGVHIRHIADIWTQASSERIKAQLEKIDIGSDERAAIRESLLTVANKY